MRSLLSWFQLSNKNDLPSVEAKYKHLASSEAGTAFDDVSARWKQRFYALVIVYIVIILCGKLSEPAAV